MDICTAAEQSEQVFTYYIISWAIYWDINKNIPTLRYQYKVTFSSLTKIQVSLFTNQVSKTFCSYDHGLVPKNLYIMPLEVLNKTLQARWCFADLVNCYWTSIILLHSNIWGLARVYRVTFHTNIATYYDRAAFWEWICHFRKDTFSNDLNQIMAKTRADSLAALLFCHSVCVCVALSVA